MIHYKTAAILAKQFKFKTTQAVVDNVRGLILANNTLSNRMAELMGKRGDPLKRAYHDQEGPDFKPLETVRESLREETLFIKRKIRANGAKAADLARPEVDRFLAEASEYCDTLEAEEKRLHELFALDQDAFRSSPTVAGLRECLRQCAMGFPDGAAKDAMRERGDLFVQKATAAQTAKGSLLTPRELQQIDREVAKEQARQRKPVDPETFRLVTTARDFLPWVEEFTPDVTALSWVPPVPRSKPSPPVLEKPAHELHPEDQEARATKIDEKKKAARLAAGVVVVDGKAYLPHLAPAKKTKA